MLIAVLRVLRPSDITKHRLLYYIYIYIYAYIYIYIGGEISLSLYIYIYISSLTILRRVYNTCVTYSLVLLLCYHI